MPELMNLLPPEDDEIFYSYLSRVAKANGFSNICAMFTGFIGTEIIPRQYKEYGLHRYYGAFAKFCKKPDGEADFFMKHSMLPIYSPIMTAGIQQQSLENAYTRQKGQRPMALLPIRSLSYCPLCAEEQRIQFGYVWFKRIHQIYGVTACPIHKCKLLKYQGIFGTVDQNLIDFAIVEPAPDEIVYSTLIKTFMEARIETDRLHVAQAITRRAKELGWDARNRRLHRQVLKRLPEKLGKTLSARVDDIIVGRISEKSFPLVVLVIEVAFENLAHFNSYLLKDEKKYERFQDAMVSNYELIGSYNETAVELENLVSGAHFMITPVAFICGKRESSNLENPNYVHQLGKYLETESARLIAEHGARFSPKAPDDIFNNAIKIPSENKAAVENKIAAEKKKRIIEQSKLINTNEIKTIRTKRNQSQSIKERKRKIVEKSKQENISSFKQVKKMR